MEILLDNPIIIAILIGLVSTIFNKVKDDSKDQNRPGRPARPVMREPDHKPASRKQTANPGRSNPVTKTKPAVEKKLSPVLESKSLNAKNVADLQNKYQNKKADSSSPAVRPPVSAERVNPSTGSKRDTEVEMNLQPDAGRLIEGIVWAEVLGPPRAKKPHRPLGRR